LVEGDWSPGVGAQRRVEVVHSLDSSSALPRQGAARTHIRNVILFFWLSGGEEGILTPVLVPDDSPSVHDGFVERCKRTTTLTGRVLSIPSCVSPCWFFPHSLFVSHPDTPSGCDARAHDISHPHPHLATRVGIFLALAFFAVLLFARKVPPPILARRAARRMGTD
jgi:hypothetical protein